VVPPLQDQGQSDSVLDDLSCMLGCTRSSLHGEAAGNHGMIGHITMQPSKAATVAPQHQGWLYAVSLLRAP
jgi:DNA topoisomerase VI subunit A